MADVIIHSPMTGRVIEVLVAEGEQVGAGDVVVVIESMKMENEVICDVDGSVATVHVEEDQSVSEGDRLVEVAT
ncbi:MAG: biotin/lipoyl-binding protein [Dehalococcoidia bacterium]|nr:biotin/lipoyl-binding protein [Dehalococcoidia bacterium]